jgi:iron complex transport system substrate-binding protein
LAVPETTPRIVSLLPAVTEIVVALGLEHRLVGRSQECDEPRWVRRLPPVTRATIPSSVPSGEIHAAVTEKLAQAVSLYEVDWARLRELSPDLIITQDQCSACGVSLADLEGDICERLGKPARVLSLAPRTLDDVWGDVRRVAEAVGLPALGERVASRLDDQVAAVRARTAGLKRPAVAAIEWYEPLMVAGHWVPELIEAAGGWDVLGVAGNRAEFITPETFLDSDPDVVVAMPCGFDLPRAQAEIATLTSWASWPSMKAVRYGRVALTDGNAFFNRPGPRLAESAQILAEILHPEYAAFGHAGRTWTLFET